MVFCTYLLTSEPGVPLEFVGSLFLHLSQPALLPHLGHSGEGTAKARFYPSLELFHHLEAGLGMPLCNLKFPREDPGKFYIVGERRIAYLARYFCTCKLFISFNSCCSFMMWELLPVFDGWEYGSQNRWNHLSRVMWLSFWSSHLNAGGHLLFLSWDPSYDPLPTISGLWEFHEASLGAPCPLGNRWLCHVSASPS